MALHHRSRTRRSAVGRTSTQHTPRSRAVPTQQREVTDASTAAPITASQIWVARLHPDPASFRINWHGRLWI
eukprot:5551603-Prymnesium_polylepis.1